MALLNLKVMKRVIIGLIIIVLSQQKMNACSFFYYVDKATQKIYFINNEDYWYHVKAYIQIVPRSKQELARVWYGWNNFAQGGVNESGLCFDAATTPKQKIPDRYHDPNGRNIGDEILAKCKTVEEAVSYLEQERIAVSEGHILLGDKTGNAILVEWINGEQKIIRIKDNILIATNYLLSDTSAGNYPCFRYSSIEERLNQLNQNNEVLDLRKVGNAIGGAVQLPQKNDKGETGGTLYTTFINISDMEFVMVYKLDNTKVTKLDLKIVFESTHKKKIKLE